MPKISTMSLQFGSTKRVCTIRYAVATYRFCCTLKSKTVSERDDLAMAAKRVAAKSVSGFTSNLITVLSDGVEISSPELPALERVLSAIADEYVAGDEKRLEVVIITTDHYTSAVVRKFVSPLDSTTIRQVIDRPSLERWGHEEPCVVSIQVGRAVQVTRDDSDGCKTVSYIESEHSFVASDLSLAGLTDKCIWTEESPEMARAVVLAYSVELDYAIADWFWRVDNQLAAMLNPDQIKARLAILQKESAPLVEMQDRKVTKRSTKNATQAKTTNPKAKKKGLR